MTVMLVGCAIPASPPQITPVSDATMGLSAVPTPTIATDWWHSFGDPQLDRLIADAMEGSPTLESALARVRQAEAVLATRRASDGPEIALDAQEQIARLSGRYTIPPPYAGTVRAVGTTQANLNWNLDLFGRQKAAIESARLSTQANVLDLNAARLALSGAVAQTYINLARAEKQAEIAQRAINTREASSRLIAVRIRNQLASQVDAQAAITLVAQARQTLLRAQAAQTLARNALAALAGLGSDYAANIQKTALSLDGGLELPDELPADLIARRADIAAAQARIAAAAAGRQVARRSFYPNVNLNALVGVQAIGIGNLFSLDAGAAGAGPAVHLPLFDNGRLKADLTSATAALDLAIADYNNHVVGAVREAADALARIDSLHGDRARQSEIERGLTETGRLNAIRVASGLDSRLGPIDNDIRLLNAQQANADLATDAALQRIALVLALGGGLTASQSESKGSTK